MNNKFMKPAFGGRATLSQTGSMHADYDFAKQWSNISALLVQRLNRGTI